MLATSFQARFVAMRCTQCNHESAPGMRFCGACGASLETSCPSCHKSVPADASFCGYCGTRLVDPVVEARQAERRQLTVLFCDLVDSTALSQRLDPEDLREVLHSYHQLVNSIIERFEGTVAQYLGDGVLAYFGYPVAHEDDAARAVLAGLEIADCIDDVSRGWSDVDAHVRVGIHTGPVVVGDVGHGQQIEQLALGATPNIAARIQGLAAADEVVLSETSAQLVQTAVQLEALGVHSLKGVDEPMAAYRASGTRQDTVTRIAARTETPFVGRRRELEELLSLQQRLVDGHSHMLILRGEPGIGKSRLLHEVRSRSETNWQICRCSAHFQNRPLYPVLSLIGELHGGFDDEAAFSGWFRRHHSDPERAEAVVRRLLGLPVETRALESLGPGQQRRQTVAVLADLLLSISRESPTTLVVENLHWADPSTLELLEHLAQRLERSRVLLILTARSDFALPWIPVSSHTLMELVRLSSKESAELVSRWAGGQLDAKTAEALVQRSDGVPLFLEEVTRFSLQAGSAGASSGAVPLSLRDSITARLDALGDARGTAQLAALLGRRFFLHQLESVSRQPSGTLREHLDRMVRSGLVAGRASDEGELFEFRHALVQDAAYETILRRERVRLHEQVVQALETAALTFGDDIAAWHYHGAGQTDRAVSLYAKSARQALAQWALAESIALYHRALELLATLPASVERDRRELKYLSELATPLQAYHNFTAPELFEMVQRKRELIESLDPEERFSALMSVWSVYGSAGTRGYSENLADELMAMAHEHADQTQIQQANWVVGYTRLLQCAPAESLEYFDALVSGMLMVAPDRLNVSHLELGVLMYHGWVLVMRGDMGGAARSFDLAISVAERTDSPLSRTHVYSYLNLIRQDMEWSPQEVLDTAERMIRMTREHDMDIWTQYFEMHAGWAEAELGDEAGIDRLEAALQNAYSSDLSMRGHSILSLVQANLRHRRYEAAKVWLDEADAFVERNIACFTEGDGLRLRAGLMAATGDLLASEQFRKSIELSQKRGHRLAEVKARRDQIEIIGPTPERLEGLAAAIGQMPDGRDIPAVRAAMRLLDDQG